VGADPADVPGALHPARRHHQPRPEPLELDPTLLGDPPAAHPPTSELPPSLLDEPETPSLADADDDDTGDGQVRHPARHWPLADQMVGSSGGLASSGDDVAVVPDSHDGAGDGAGDGTDDSALGQGTARHRAPSRAKSRRPSVPSWDDIMFGAKRD
jgi:hypothetical protein